jgi:hypothetical protein
MSPRQPFAPLFEALLAAMGRRSVMARILGVSQERIRQRLEAEQLVEVAAVLRWVTQPTPESVLRKYFATDTRRRLAYRAHGRCRCGRPPDPGTKTCARCKAQRSRLNGQRYKRLVEAGICKRCGQRPRSVPKHHCRMCLADMAARAMGLRRQRLAAGKCATCGRRPPLEGTWRCDPCHAAERASAARRRARRKVRSRVS